MTLAVHADRDDLPEGVQHIQLLYPFWGIPPEDPGDVTRGRFERFAAEAKTLFRLTPLDEADIVVYPAAWELVAHRPELVAHAAELAARARAAGKPFVVFFISDSAEPVPIDGAIVFRTSMFRSRRRPGEHAIPLFTEDFVERYFDGREDVRPKRTPPTVGFMGYDSETRGFARKTAKRLLGRPVVSTRGRLLRAFRGSDDVETNFVVRDAFFGGSMRGGSIDAEAQRRVREEYVANLRASDYAIAVRGSETWGKNAGNFSARLYEVLSAGRIPVFVDTDSVMPYEEILDWKSFTFWLEPGEVRTAARRLRRFHDALDDEQFADRQRRARATWEEYLSPHGYFRHFHTYFD